MTQEEKSYLHSMTLPGSHISTQSKMAIHGALRHIAEMEPPFEARLAGEKRLALREAAHRFAEGGDAAARLHMWTSRQVCEYLRQMALEVE